MRLRTKKRLLNLAATGLLAGAVGVGVVSWRLVPPESPDIAGRPVVQPASVVTPAAPTLAVDPARWNRTLRQPLYDPPPPPKKEVVVQQRPITIKLVGTVIEGENSQAFVRQASGAVELKRLGDQVTPDAADGVVADITPTSIVIRRPDGDHQVSIERRN